MKSLVLRKPGSQGLLTARSAVGIGGHVCLPRSQLQSKPQHRQKTAKFVAQAQARNVRRGTYASLRSGQCVRTGGQILDWASSKYLQPNADPFLKMVHCVGTGVKVCGAYHSIERRSLIFKILSKIANSRGLSRMPACRPIGPF